MVTVTQFLEGGTFVGKNPNGCNITLTLTKTEVNNVYRVDYEFDDEYYIFIKILNVDDTKIYFQRTLGIRLDEVLSVKDIEWFYGDNNIIPFDVNDVITEAEHLENLSNQLYFNT